MVLGSTIGEAELHYRAAVPLVLAANNLIWSHGAFPLSEKLWFSFFSILTSQAHKELLLSFDWIEWFKKIENEFFPIEKIKQYDYGLEIFQISKIKMMRDFINEISQKCPRKCPIFHIGFNSRSESRCYRWGHMNIVFVVLSVRVGHWE